MSVTTICCVLGVCCADSMLMGVFRLCIVTSWLVNACTLHVTGLLCLSFTLEKVVTFLLFLFLITFFFHSSQPIGRTNVLNYWRRRHVLTAILFKIRVNNSSKYLSFPAYEKWFAQFLCLYIFNSWKRHYSDSKRETTVFYLERTGTRSSQHSHLKMSEIGWAPVHPKRYSLNFLKEEAVVLAGLDWDPKIP